MDGGDSNGTSLTSRSFTSLHVSLIPECDSNSPRKIRTCAGASIPTLTRPPATRSKKNRDVFADTNSFSDLTAEHEHL